MSGSRRRSKPRSTPRGPARRRRHGWRPVDIVAAALFFGALPFAAGFGLWQYDQRTAQPGDPPRIVDQPLPTVPPPTSPTDPPAELPQQAATVVAPELAEPDRPPRIPEKTAPEPPAVAPRRESERPALDPVPPAVELPAAADLAPAAPVEPAVLTPVAGALEPAQRRALLSGRVLPAGFTREWQGGPASGSPGANEITRGAAAGGRVALTFDGNYENKPVGELLDILSARGVRATFFVTGGFARRFPAAVRQMAAAGHEIANHSDTHPAFTKLSDAKCRAELERAEQAILPLAGDAYRPYWRPPFGDRNTRVLRLAVRAGFVPIYWTADTLDWQTSATPESVLGRVRRLGLKPGAIILQHIGAQPTLKALERELDLLAEQGLTPGSLDELFS